MRADIILECYLHLILNFRAAGYKRKFYAKTSMQAGNIKPRGTGYEHFLPCDDGFCMRPENFLNKSVVR
jgi:hypothetical protein